MDKKEKYINYIVDKMVRGTIIDYDQEEINYPFSLSSFYPLPFLPLPFSSLFCSYIAISFSKHVKEIYGARDDEVREIWNIYNKRIYPLINNE